MNILYLIDRYFPNDDSFIEEVQTKIIPAKGHHVTIVARTRKFKVLKYKKWNDATLILIPSQIKYLTELKHFLKLKRIVEKEWDIIQIRNDPLFAMLCMHRKFIYQLTHLKAEEFIHSSQKNLFKIAKGCFDLLLRPLIVRRAWCTISISQSMTRYLKEKYGVRNIFDLPMGVPEFERNESKIEQVRNRYNLAGKVVFIYVGTMIKARRLDVLLHAFKRIEGTKAALLMLGDAPNIGDVHWLKNISEDLQLSSVIFIKRVPRSNVPDYIGAADIGLAVTPLTTVNRCMSPTKTLEYLNCETPVLATNIPDQADVITRSQSGVICRFEVSDIAEKMNEMIDHRRELKKMGSDGKRYVREYRNYRRLAMTLIGRYNEMLGS